MALEYPPVNFEDLKIGAYGAIPNEAADYAWGPEVSGVPVWPLQYFIRWVAWKSSDGVRIAEYTPGFVPSDSEGSLLDHLFDGDTDFSDLSLSWDQTGSPAVAVERSDGTVEVRRRQGGTLTAFAWPGKSPVLFFNGEVEYRTPLTDIVCYYLPLTGDKILMRVQRENFGVEHVVHETLPTPAGRLLKADLVGTRLTLWGMTDGIRRKDRHQLIFRTAPHQPWPSLIYEAASLSAGFTGGQYLPVVAELEDAFEEAASLSAGFTGGDYFSALVTHAESDSAQLALGFASGLYFLTLVETDPTADSATLTTGFTGGNYQEVVVGPVEEAEQSTLNLGFTGGEYVSA